MMTASVFPFVLFTSFYLFNFLLKSIYFLFQTSILAIVQRNARAPLSVCLRLSERRSYGVTCCDRKVVAQNSAGVISKSSCFLRGAAFTKARLYAVESSSERLQSSHLTVRQVLYVILLLPGQVSVPQMLMKAPPRRQ